MNDQYLLTLNIPQSLEESMVDCLLQLESELGFSSFPVNVHHHQNRGLSIAEQVTGRQKRVRFQINVSAKDLPELVASIKADFAGSGIRYWVLPIVEHGMM
ncbi:hypothetical protein JCM14076_10540 [Methylosoma difficile]